MNDPNLVYVEGHDSDHKTLMKWPSYAYPEVLKDLLPIPVADDAALAWPHDEVARMVHAHNRDNKLFYRIVGQHTADTLKKSRRAFCSLDMNESPSNKRPGNFLTHVCLHSYHHHGWNIFSDWGSKSDNAIGCIGFHFALDDEPESTDPSRQCHNEHLGHPSSNSKAKTKSLHLTSTAAPADIQEIRVYYKPNSGRIAGLEFRDEHDQVRLAMMQWSPDGAVKNRPRSIDYDRIVPPKLEKGLRWQFVGLAGEFVNASAIGQVLARVGGIWRKI